jgi:hypothetical protein
MLRNTVRRACGAALMLACLAVMPGAARGEGPRHALRYRFTPDSTLHYVVGNDTSIYVQVGATAETVQHASESGRVLRTLAINPDGSAVLQVQIEYVNLSAGNGAIGWDSRSGEPPPADFAGIENTIGRPLMNVTIASDGTIIAAENGGKAADKAQLESTQFDLLPILPKQPIAIGESWTEPFQVDVLTDMKLTKKISMQREYTLLAVDQGVAEIDVRTTVLTPIQDPLEEGQLIQRTPSGSFRLHIEQGRLLERMMKIDNKVVGFQGPQTALRVVGTRQENLGSEEKTAAGPAKTSVQ